MLRFERAVIKVGTHEAKQVAATRQATDHSVCVQVRQLIAASRCGDHSDKSFCVY